MHQLRCLRAEKLERCFVAGKKRRDQLHLALLLQPVQAFVHNGRARLLILAGQQLHIAEPGEKIIQLQLRAGGRVGELGKFRFGTALEDVDEVGQQIVVQTHAVEENFEDIARLGLDRLLRRVLLRLLLRLGSRGKLRDGCVQLGRVKAVIFLLRDLRSVRLGAGSDKGGNAHFRDLCLQLHGLFEIVLLRQRNARGRLARSLADLG